MSRIGSAGYQADRGGVQVIRRSAPRACPFARGAWLGGCSLQRFGGDGG